MLIVGMLAASCIFVMPVKMVQSFDEGSDLDGVDIAAVLLYEPYFEDEPRRVRFCKICFLK